MNSNNTPPLHQQNESANHQTFHPDGNKKWSRIWIFLLLFLFLLAWIAIQPGKTQAQQTMQNHSVQIPLKVYLYSGDKKVKGGEIKVYDRNQLIQEIELPKKHALRLQIPGGTYITIEASAPGHFPKRVALDTRFPYLEDFIPHLAPLDFNLKLVKKGNQSVAEQELLEFPAALFSFNRDEIQFTYDQTYQKNYLHEQMTLRSESARSNRTALDARQQEDELKQQIPGDPGPPFAVKGIERLEGEIRISPSFFPERPIRLLA